MSRLRLIQAQVIGLSIVVGGLHSVSARQAGLKLEPGNGVGFELRLDSLPSPHPRPVVPAPGDVPPEAGPIWLRFTIPWALVEKSAGQYSWAPVDEIVTGFATAGFGVILHPKGGHPLYDDAVAPPSPPEEAWAAFLRDMAARYAREVDYYLLDVKGASPVASANSRVQAFAFKSSSIAVRAADSSALIAIVGPRLDGEGPAAVLEALCAEGIAPYFDALSLADAVAPDKPESSSAIDSVRAVLMTCDPGAPLWLSEIAIEDRPASAGRLLRSYLAGLRHEAALSTFALASGDDGMPRLLPVLDRIRKTFLPTDTPLVESSRGVTAVSAMGTPLTIATIRLFGDKQQRALLAYDPGPETARGSQAVLTLDSLEVAGPVLHDIAAGEQGAASALQRDEANGVTRLPVPLAEYPLVIEYRRRASETSQDDERLQVTAERVPSVEEILAQQQAVQAAQDALLTNMTAEARIDYHFRVGTGPTIDITINAGFYWDKETGAEFEQREFFVNGVKWRSDRIPEFPLPQPEKVLTLPLDLTLDRRYRYRLDGQDKVAGRECWVIAFTPLEEDRTLISGRVWIDRENWARLRVTSVQTGLTPPLLSNEESDTYAPVVGPGAISYWLLDRIEGQQLFSAIGRNLVMLREVTFSNHAINTADFEVRRQGAYASSHPIVRDTPSGQRYLEKTEAGRRVKEEMDRDNLFLLGGVFYNRSLDFPLPLAGVNYFNRDLGGRGIQTNVFFGGVLLRASASHPNLFGAGIEATADLSLQGFSGNDRPVRGEVSIKEEGVDVTGQELGLSLGLPFADYWKVKVLLEGEFQGFARDKETRSGFVIPGDTMAGTAGLQGEFNRAGWTVTAVARATSRKDWECWGDCVTSTPGAGGFTPAASNYVRTEAAVARDFFLPFNQKIRGAIAVFGGEDLDRFSRHRFDFFGNRVRGLSGSGVRFSRGQKARLEYSFNLGSIVRFEATIDHARVTDPDPILQRRAERLAFTGFGLSGQTILGPNLMVNLDWGVAVRSDVQEYQGDQEFLVTVLRLFR